MDLLATFWAWLRRRPFWAQALVWSVPVVVAVVAFAGGGDDDIVAGADTTTATERVITTVDETQRTTTTAAEVESDATTVERIIDGDTFVAAGGVRVRLIGIDTPETKDPGSPVECFGAEATAHLTELIPPGTEIRLVYDVERLDGFGRTLAYVYRASDDAFVNLAMVADGYAAQLTVPPNVEHADRFLEAAADARDSDRGLWSACGGVDSPATTVTTAQPTLAPPPPPAPVLPVAPPPSSSADDSNGDGCHDSYVGDCVRPDVADVNCPEVDGPVQVVGDDEYGLDRDGDGVGCES